MEVSGKNVAVLDTIHGGKTICHKLHDAGVSADAIDIYKDPPAAAVIGSYDVVAAPIHAHSPLISRANEIGIPIISHHKLVGQLAERSPTLRDALVFEITGVKAKTTTAVLLQQAFRDKSVISLTSRGFEASERGRYVVKERLSITPASVLVALDLVDELELSPTVCIFETSLGGTGIGDINVLTTLSPEYSIADGHRTSTEAKLQMVSLAKAGSCLIAPPAVTSHASRPCVNSIGGPGATVYCETTKDRNVRIKFEALRRRHGDHISGELSFIPTGYYDLRAYQVALLCFVAAGLAAHLEVEFIERMLSSFKGVRGRVCVTTVNHRTLIDNSNSGLDAASIRHAIDFGLKLKKPGHKAVLIIGEEAKNICDGMRPDVVASSANNEAFEDIVFVGEPIPISRSHIHRRENLKSALSTAMELTREHDVIVSCVKTWR